MSDSDSGVSVRFSKAEALVLFELLSRIGSEERSITPDTAEWHALNSLLCLLESVLVEPFRGDYPKIISDAKQEHLEKFGDTLE